MPDMPERVSAEVIRELVEGFGATRPVFEKLYDTVVDPLPNTPSFRALALGREHAERSRKPPGPSLEGLARDQADFEVALRFAEEAGVLVEFLAKNMVRLVRPEAAVRLGVTLQSVVHFEQSFTNALPLTAERMIALRRACRIFVAVDDDQPIAGSGFLIGPNLVLTNWHVVQTLIEQAQARPASHRKITVEFDALLRADESLESIKAYQPVERWLIDFRPAHIHETVGSGGPNGPWPADPNVLYEHLDYAVIELDGSPGYDRGYYDLPDWGRPKPGTGFDLFQFPNRAMACMPGEFREPGVFADVAKPARILHTANTVRGSSGGLCLNLQGKAVAMHQAGFEFRTEPVNGRPQQVANLNSAVPLPLIKAAAGEKVAARIEAAPRLRRKARDGMPILGRQKFQTLVNEAIRGTARILVVHAHREAPGGKLGKTFSAKILKALVPDEHLVCEVPASRLTSDAHAAARVIVEQVQAVPPDLRAPDSQEPLNEAASASLAERVVSLLQQANGTGMLWLVIDDLDRHPVQAESSTSMFLNSLYKRTSHDPNLRVVLIGPAATLPGLNGLLFKADLILAHIEVTDVQDWISAEFPRQLPIVPELARLLAAVVESNAKSGATDSAVGRTKAIADVLQAHWAPSLEKRP